MKKILSSMIALLALFSQPTMASSDDDSPAVVPAAASRFKQKMIKQLQREHHISMFSFSPHSRDKGNLKDLGEILRQSGVTKAIFDHPDFPQLEGLAQAIASAPELKEVTVMSTPWHSFSPWDSAYTYRPQPYNEPGFLTLEGFVAALGQNPKKVWLQGFPKQYQALDLCDSFSKGELPRDLNGKLLHEITFETGQSHVCGDDKYAVEGRRRVTKIAWRLRQTFGNQIKFGVPDHVDYKTGKVLWSLERALQKKELRNVGLSVSSSGSRLHQSAPSQISASAAVASSVISADFSPASPIEPSVVVAADSESRLPAQSYDASAAAASILAELHSVPSAVVHSPSSASASASASAPVSAPAPAATPQGSAAQPPAALPPAAQRQENHGHRAHPPQENSEAQKGGRCTIL